MAAESYRVPVAGPEESPEVPESTESHETAESTESSEVLESPESGERPAGLPENYKSVEDMAAALLAAQQKITELGQSKGDGPAPSDLQGLLARAIQEAKETGSATEETAAALEGLGLSRAIQKRSIKAELALEAATDSEIMGVFDGKTGYEEFCKWAPENLSSEEINSLNAMIEEAYNGGNSAPLKLAAAGAMQRFKATQKSDDPRVVNGSPNRTTSGVQPYATKPEAMAVIHTAAYKKGDRSVHALHQARLKVSEPGILSRI